jgi:hypothetical protein
VGGIIYKKFFDPYYNNNVYLREDVATRKVYKLVNNVEEMLYDFSLVHGQSITLSNGNTYTVHISTANVVGGTRKQVTLQHQFFQGETWIEGVGSNRHPFVRTYTMPSDPHVYLTCSAQNGENVYNHGVVNGNPPTDCSMLLSTIDNERKAVAVYPNPFSTVLTVDLAQPVQNADIEIFDIQGKLLRSAKTSGQSISITRDGLHPGLYLLKISENNVLVWTQKIVIEN